VVRKLQAAWPNAKYYLGFLTTVLVGAAWLINLRTKPLATVFGGGLTILGVAISVVYYRYQQSRGVAPVIPDYYLRPLPHSLLVVLDPRSANNAAVVRAACQSAQDHPLVILALGHPELREVRSFEIVVPYSYDPLAQQTLSLAAAVCRREEAQAHFVYRVETPNAVLDAWRVIQPDEIIAESELAKVITKHVSPDTVRIQQSDGVKVLHIVKRRVSPLESAGTPGERLARGRSTASRATATITAPPAALETTLPRDTSPFTAPPAPPQPARRAGAPGLNGTQPPRRRQPPAAPAPDGARRTAAPHGSGTSATPAGPGRPVKSGPTASSPHPTPAPVTPAEDEPPVPPQTGAAPPNVDLDQYIWTGTDFVRLDELEDTEHPAAGGESGEEGAGDSDGGDGGTTDARGGDADKPHGA
jgi:hypothetical protein